MNHIKIYETNIHRRHKSRHKKTYEQTLRDAIETKKTSGSLNKFLVATISPEALDIYKWLEWIIMSDLPFNFVENSYTRSCAKMCSITVNSLKKYLTRLHSVVEKSLAQRSCMTPWRLEMLLFLRSNRDLWDEKVVQQIILLNSNDETEALEEEDAEALEI